MSSGKPPPTRRNVTRCRSSRLTLRSSAIRRIERTRRTGATSASGSCGRSWLPSGGNEGFGRSSTGPTPTTGAIIAREAGRTKLDYLQFLELEVFTRFGARLEASSEAKIKRGRILREILKQDRLSPLPVEFQLAWLVAFHEGFLDQAPLDEISETLKRLAQEVKSSGLRLEDKREDWKPALEGWLGRPENPKKHQ